MVILQPTSTNKIEKSWNLDSSTFFYISTFAALLWNHSLASLVSMQSKYTLKRYAGCHRKYHSAIPYHASFSCNVRCFLFELWHICSESVKCVGVSKWFWISLIQEMETYFIASKTNELAFKFDGQYISIRYESQITNIVEDIVNFWPSFKRHDVANRSTWTPVWVHLLQSVV